MLERLVLLDTLDTTWKDHLYQMDQLRDSIGFRAFSQQDPRIEYKREGQRQFLAMMESQCPIKRPKILVLSSKVRELLRNILSSSTNFKASMEAKEISKTGKNYALPYV